MYVFIPPTSECSPLSIEDHTDGFAWLKCGSLYYVVRYTLNRLDLENDKESVARKAAAAAVLRRLDPQEADPNGENGRPRRSKKESLVLNQYEQMVAMDVVAPEDIPVTFDGSSRILDCVVESTKDDRYWRPHRYNR